MQDCTQSYGVKRLQMSQIFNIGLKPTQSAKRLKQTCSTLFLGDVGVKKWSLFFCLGAGSAIFCHLKMGTFGKSNRFQVPKNGIWGAQTKKPRPLFNVNIPPKWWRARLFYAFSTFGWVFSQFWKIVFLEALWSCFYCYMSEKLKVPNDNQRSAQIKKLKKTNQLYN